MIITRSPNRISLVGGGSDFPAHFLKHGGLCVGGAIDKYSYIHARWMPEFHSYRSRFVYSQTETCSSNDEVSHRAIRETLKYFEIGEAGLEITHCSDIPAKSGVGSSSTFVVCLSHALACLQGKYMSAGELAQAAIQIEQKRLGEAVGCQDQVWAAYGGIRALYFRKSGEIDAIPLELPHTGVEDLEQHLMLFFTKEERISSHVISSCKPTVCQNIDLTNLAYKAMDALHIGDYRTVGNCVEDSWRIKRSLSPDVSNKRLDFLHDVARVHGAYGCKLTGAGGGGSMLVVCDPADRQIISAKMVEQGCVHIPFRFDFTGSSVIFSGAFARV